MLAFVFHKKVFFRAENTGICMLFEVWGSPFEVWGHPRGLRGPSSEKLGKSWSFAPPPGAPEVAFWEVFPVFQLFFPVCFPLLLLEGPFEAFPAPEAPQETQNLAFRVPFWRPFAGGRTL